MEKNIINDCIVEIRRRKINDRVEYLYFFHKKLIKKYFIYENEYTAKTALNCIRQQITEIFSNGYSTIHVENYENTPKGDYSVSFQEIKK